jgi:hypothetical protein
MKGVHFISALIGFALLFGSGVAQESQVTTSSEPTPLPIVTPTGSSTVNSTGETTVNSPAPTVVQSPGVDPNVESTTVKDPPASSSIGLDSETAKNTKHRGHHRHHHHQPVVIVQPTPVFVAPRSETVVIDRYVTPPTSEILSNETPVMSGDYSQFGRDWAIALRRRTVSWSQFVNFMRVYIVRASLPNYTAFRNGFLYAYGAYGPDVFEQGFQQAY